jgi:serine protease Do
VKKLKTSAAIFGIIVICMWLFAMPATAATPKQIYQMAGPAVVFILASEGSAMGNVGTGSIIRADGLVITNAHIFTKKGTTKLKSEISIFLKPKRVTGNHKKDLALRYKGKILAYDVPLDLALVKIAGLDSPLSSIEFADSQVVDIGDEVYAIGHPEQGGLWSLTTGVISAYRQDYGGIHGKNLFQTDASINRGNSGGPLLDENGYMVGINSMIARKAKDGLTITDVNYSIMSDVALNWLAGLGYRFPVKHAVAAETQNKSVTVSEPANKKPVEIEAEVKEPPPQAKPAEEPPPPPPPAKPIEPAKPLKKDTDTRQQKIEDKPTGSPDKSGDDLQPPTGEPSPEKAPTKDPDGGRILTQKKPYKMSQLLRDMQEMEDMMEDMRGKIKTYKNKK